MFRIFFTYWSAVRTERVLIFSIGWNYDLQNEIGTREVLSMYGKKVKLSLLQAVKAHSVLRRRDFHIFWTIGS
jgi:hypothetical protein